MWTPQPDTVGPSWGSTAPPFRFFPGQTMKPSPGRDAHLFRLNLPFLAGPLLRELEDRYGKGGEAQRSSSSTTAPMWPVWSMTGRRAWPFCRPLRPVVSWGLEHAFDFSRLSSQWSSTRRRTVWHWATPDGDLNSFTPRWNCWTTRSSGTDRWRCAAIQIPATGSSWPRTSPPSGTRCRPPRPSGRPGASARSWCSSPPTNWKKVPGTTPRPGQRGCTSGTPTGGALLH